MPIVTATEVAHAYGADELFSGANLQLDARERVGLVGPNGVGKTTLLRILAGLQEPLRGQVIVNHELTLGYLQQEAVLTFRGQNNTVYEELLTVFGDLRALEEQMRALEQQMASGDFNDQLLAQYGRLQARYEIGGGYDYAAEIKLTLLGLGFAEQSWQTPLLHLSGGQKTRVLLARLLLEKPDLLILDEPTNHLDLEAVEWLENVLRRWAGSLILVSHDRYFLDRIVTTIWELAPGGLRSYRGDYTNYVAQRQQEWEREESLFAAEKARLEKELDFIQKNIAGGSSDQAKGRLKRLTRDIILLETFPVTEIIGRSWSEVGGRVRTLSANEAALRLRRLRMISSRPPVMRVKLQPTDASERLVLQTEGLRIGYPDAPIATIGKLRIERHDRIALLGANGSGKTTLLRTLLGDLPPLDGTVERGENLLPGYFAQAHDQLNPERRVIDELRAAEALSEQDARNFLSRYLFRGDAVFKRIADLSGGERGRLALAILATIGANFLLLDEPTNHLDLTSQEVLQAVLADYDGTLLFVTHDRYLVSKLATQIWELRDGRLYRYSDGYARYLEQRALEIERAEAAAAGQPPPAQLTPDLGWIDMVREIATSDAPELADLTSRQGRRQWGKRVGALEQALDDAEAHVEELEMQLEDARLFGEAVLVVELEAELEQAQNTLDDLLAEWDELMG